jgi:hypothetical protein
MSAREETYCFRCGTTFPTQDGYRVFWTDADGKHAFCSPQHALESAAESDKIIVKRDNFEQWRRAR